MRRLEGRSVIITGGASGIGRAIALRFADEGARIVLADITANVREGGTPTIDLLRTQGAVADFVSVDVSQESAAQELIDAALARDGRLDVVVNNAAIGNGKALTETTLEEWSRVIAINLTGVFLMARAAVRAMCQQEPRGDGVRGRLVNISSQHGMVACPEDVAYGTSKAGVVYITRQIAVDYANQGIICNAVAPGKVVTGKPGRAAEQRWMDYSRARTPLPRLGRPEDVASAALFLASDEASFITGENLLVDGGWMAG